MNTTEILLINGVLILMIIILLIRVTKLEKRIKQNIDYQRKYNQNILKIICDFK